jgi:DNA-binding GntR family transcriptional regulator
VSDQKQENKSRSVYNKLRNEILNKRLFPGERLVERELVKQFDASSIIIREALSNLARDGLVTLQPYRGATVTKLKKKDIEEIYELREELESLASRLAAKRIDNVNIEKLTKELIDTEKKIKNGTLNYIEAIEKIKVHEKIGELCGNSRLHRIVHEIHSQTKLLINTTLASENRPQIAFEEEVNILKAIIEKDVKRAEKNARKHILDAKKIILEETN